MYRVIIKVGISIQSKLKLTIPIESELSACAWSTTWGPWAPERASQSLSEAISLHQLTDNFRHSLMCSGH